MPETHVKRQFHLPGRCKKSAVSESLNYEVCISKPMPIYFWTKFTASQIKLVILSNWLSAINDDFLSRLPEILEI